MIKVLSVKRRVVRVCEKLACLIDHSIQITLLASGHNNPLTTDFTKQVLVRPKNLKKSSLTKIYKNITLILSK
jgi:hypothetical protein